MSFFDLLEKIRSKPRYIRVQILWFLVAICMFVVVSLWLTSLGGLEVKSQQANIGQELAAPLGELKQELPSLKKILKDSLNVFFEKEPETEQEPQESEQPEQKQKNSQPAKLPLR